VASLTGSLTASGPASYPPAVDVHSLEGRRALVCGSTQGIGRAAARELASRGAVVTLFARDATALERVRGAAGTGHAFLVADFGENESVRTAVTTGDPRPRRVPYPRQQHGRTCAGPILDASPTPSSPRSERTWSTTRSSCKRSSRG
jgi:hypothetical protein